MEEMASLWSYQESIDELKQKLLYTSLELESLRAEATEEMKRNKESLKQLLHLLKIACQERDEARDQLQKLLLKIMPPTTRNDQQIFTTNTTIIPNLHPESPLLKPTKANSSITESNSFSDPYNNPSNSSPVDSLFDTVSSPEFSNTNNIENLSNNISPFLNRPFVQDYNNCPGMVPTNGFLSHGGVQKFDQASLVMENIVRGKNLPQKGKLLQAVLETGPLLQTLLVAGPLPRWQNPPPLHAFQVPPVSMTGSSGQISRAAMNSYVEMSCGSSSQMLSTSILNFDDENIGNGRMISAARNYVPVGKRQRFQ